MAIKGELAHWEAESFGIELLNLTVGDLLDQRAAELPDKEALVYRYPEIDLELRLTYRQYQETVNRLAKGLMALGVARGDHVAVWAPNLPEWIFLELALAKLGAVLVTINTAYRATELEYVLRQGDVKLLFLVAELRGNSYLDSLYSVAPELKRLADPVNNTAQSAALPRLERAVLIGRTAHPGLLRYEQAVARADEISDAELAARQSQVGVRDAAQMQFTSGTTGFPKGVLLSHYSLVNQAHVAVSRGRRGPEDRYVSAMPLFHIAGSLGAVIWSIYLGSTLIPLIGFDPVKHLELFEQERGTFTFAVPTMLLAMLNHPRFAEFDLSSLTAVFTGATPVPVALMEQIKTRIGADCAIVFGLTETCGAVTQSFQDDSFELKSATVGLAQPHTEIKIIDPQGATVRVGASGELCARGFSNMIGYYRMPERTAETIDAEGWLHTGDLAVMRPDGYLNIVGRAKDMIIRGGENIYPAEIEAFLMRHPAVAEAQVIGLPDAFMGEEVCALIKLKSDATADEESLRAYCRAGISRHKQPKLFRFVTAFPLTASGKVKKFELRAQLLRELGMEEAG